MLEELRFKRKVKVELEIDIVVERILLSRIWYIKI